MAHKKATTRCPHCGYDLAGLPRAAPCPECGKARPKDADKPFKNDIYSRAPLSYLRLIQAASWALALGAIVAAAASIVSSGSSSALPRMIATAASLLYLGGVWAITAPRRSPSLPRAVTAREFGVLRWVNRGTQSLWAVTHALILVRDHGALAPEIADPVRLATLIIAALGIIPCCIQLASFAEWTRDEDSAKRLNIAAWSIGLPVVWFAIVDFVPVIGTVLGIVFWFVSIALFFVFFGGFVMYFLACVGLASTASWAIKNWHDAEARDQRLRQKADAARAANAQRAGSGRSRPATAPNPGGASLARRDAEFDTAFSRISSTSDTPANSIKYTGVHRIERRSDDDPIPLEPE